MMSLKQQLNLGKGQALSFKPSQKVVARRQLAVRAGDDKNPLEKADIITQEERFSTYKIQNAPDQASADQTAAELEDVRQQRTLPEAAFGTMSFTGVPEDVNGRMCMLAFTVGVIKEIITGQSIPDQVHTTPISVWLIFFLFVVGSLITNVKQARRKDYEFGPFTETAEVYNGRTAMLGFVAILGIEFYSHTAILGQFFH